MEKEGVKIEEREKEKKGKKIIQEAGYLGNWIFREISFVQLLIDNDNFEKKKKERGIFLKNVLEENSLSFFFTKK